MTLLNKYIFKTKVHLFERICITDGLESYFPTLNSACKNVLNRMSYLVIGIILFISMTNMTTISQDEIPVSVKIPIFLKVLSFDRQLQKRAGNNLNMLIVFQGKFRQSLTEKDEVEEALDNLAINSIEGIPINYFYIDLDEIDIRNAISENHINLVYVCPLRGVSLDAISFICREKKILSFADVSSYVDNKMSVGLEMKAEKPQIIINLRNAKAEGADFSSQLLKLSRVIE